MKKETKEKLEKLFKGSEETFIVATKNGIGAVGTTGELLTLLTLTIQEIRGCKGVEEKHIETALELSKMNESQVVDKLIEMLIKSITE